MPIKARFVHVNIVARDFKRLSSFYVKVFGCIPVPPKRDLKGKWLDRATGIDMAHIEGVHLRLPGTGATLEIFQYGSREEGRKSINREGFAHIAFRVDDPLYALEEVIKEGGCRVGNPVTVNVPDAGSVLFVYARDPEGNIIELQRWDTSDDAYRCT
jgi:catechol 2,3-dioxygenase-like lactoylglutathione lyase family enzyme